MKLAGELFHLHHLKAMFHMATASLIVSDMHIGKAAHFRKHGIPIHTFANTNNFWNLSLLLDVFEAKQFLVVGDIIHSNSNDEWHAFADFLDQYPNLGRVLIRGNHDILSDDFFHQSGFVVLEHYRLGDLILRHEPEVDESMYQICGHIHPSVRFRGRAHQHERLPCFYFGERIAYLPAFGSFTGTSLVHPKKGDTVVAIANNQLIRFTEELSH